MACPICKKTSSPTYRPFCCKRCADVDLGKWMQESYSVPGEPAAVHTRDITDEE